MRRIDHTGRSTGANKPAGKARNWELPTPFVGLPRILISSPGYAALSKPARKVLDFLMLEHMAHGGTENGNLLATYSQLVDFGVSSRDVRGALEMLEAFHLIECTRRGHRLGGVRGASRYRLAWLPDKHGELPTLKYASLTNFEVQVFLSERRAASRLRTARRRQKTLRIVGK